MTLTAMRARDRARLERSVGGVDPRRDAVFGEGGRDLTLCRRRGTQGGGRLMQRLLLGKPQGTRGRQQHLRVRPQVLEHFDWAIAQFHGMTEAATTEITITESASACRQHSALSRGPRPGRSSEALPIVDSRQTSPPCMRT
jgi:hypothetical protein